MGVLWEVDGAHVRPSGEDSVWRRVGPQARLLAALHNTEVTRLEARIVELEAELKAATSWPLAVEVAAAPTAPTPEIVADLVGMLSAAASTAYHESGRVRLSVGRFAVVVAPEPSWDEDVRVEVHVDGRRLFAVTKADVCECHAEDGLCDLHDGDDVVREATVRARAWVRQGGA